MQKEKEALTGYIATPEELANWKKKHGEDNVSRLSVGEKACYVRKPNRTDLGMVDELGSNRIADHELLLNEIWLGGDEEIRTKDEYFLSTLTALRPLMQLKVAELKKV